MKWKCVDCRFETDDFWEAVWHHCVFLIKFEFHWIDKMNENDENNLMEEMNRSHFCNVCRRYHYDGEECSYEKRR